MKMVRDNTGRFRERPHYQPAELDTECERIITAFLRETNGEARFPVSTEDLTRFIERDAASLDGYADLPAGVEGVTEFIRGAKPIVRISRRIAEDPKRENRLRTTLTHEYGHVHFHRYLWELDASGDLFNGPTPDPPTCKREQIVEAPDRDWMEWQAGYACGALLMPASLVRSTVTDYRKASSFDGAFRTGTKQGSEIIEAIVGAFQVSDDAARIRLLKLKIVDQTARGQGGLFDPR